MAPPRKPEDYTLRVTAGPSYDLSTHVQVPINSSRLTHIESPEGMDIDLNVRIQNYRGLPRNSPSTSPYFDREPHKYNKDQYSIGMRFTPKRPKGVTGKPDGNGTQKNGNEEDKGISASNLQFGNDFDHPIRNYLPPGVNTAMNILKWWIDPGLEGDAYADEPFLYGPALSSFNAVRVGAGAYDEEGGGLWVEEGASSDDDDDDEDKSAEGAEEKQEKNGAESDNNNNKPSSSSSSKKWRAQVLANSGVGNDPKKRQKWALKEDAKKKWVWEYGRTYAVDFYNPYIDFGKCELKLPGFGVNVLRYWDGETGLRYVLRNRLTKKTYLVILFTLYPNDAVNEDGTLKPGALKATARASGGGKTEEDDVDWEGDAKAAADKKEVDGGFKEDKKALDEARKKLEGVALGEGPKGGNGGAGAAGGDDDVD
ncbi:hypothetical protein N0V85_006609 [Neurospora sp. IMI 360204]|nr:hypothetical protein N0V85_006609 [Neurospora sp. IMI 360204]